MQKYNTLCDIPMSNNGMSMSSINLDQQKYDITKNIKPMASQKVFITRTLSYAC